ncbi:MAG: carbon starvation CstA family protein, partial [Armatimonadota bacterium]
RDGVDFEPARPVMLFGHHFTGISGAGPIVGPILAVAYFGWAAALGWVVLGSIFIGAVHDYLALMVSARSKGRSITEVCSRVISPRASVVFAVFVWLGMLLVIAIFASLAARTLVAVPQVVWPNLALCPVAMLLGWAVYKRGVSLVWGSIAAFALLVGAMVLGYYQPLALPEWMGDPQRAWYIIVMLYCVAASVIPVWLLLQPRDYMSSTFTFAGIILGFVGLFMAMRLIGAENPPAFVGAFSDKGGPIFPMLFILVACGACSGFHSLVGSGTTSKQLPNECCGRQIGYGGMILEAAQGMLVALLAAGGLYWVGTHAAPDGSTLVLSEIMAEEGGGWASVAFVRSFAHVVNLGLPFLGFSAVLMFAGIALNATLLDTLDTCTRLARFVLTENFGKYTWVLQGRWAATIITVALATTLGLMGGAAKLWPVFGASNQLIAALALMVVAVYLVGVRRPSVYAVIPGIIMLCTTVAALVYQGYGFITAEQPNWLLGLLSFALAVLGLYVVAEAVPRFLEQRAPVQPTEPPP